MLSRSLGHRAPLLWLTLPLMAGIAAGRASDSGLPVWLLGLALGAALMAAALAYAGRRGWGTALVVALFCAGYAGYGLRNPRVASWDDLPPREARVALHIDRVFPRSDLTVAGIGTVVNGNGAVRALVGQRVYFSLRRRPEEPKAIRSAVRWGVGVLAAVPRHPEPGSFDRYLADAGVHFRLSRGRVQETVAAPARYYVWLERAAEQLNAWMSAGITAKRPDLAAVFRAMMLGQKHELSQEQDEVFMHSGTMHLFAINGLHIGVVAVSLHALLALLRCPRPLAAVFTLAVLWFDVDTTGASPSAVRAFLLVACYESGFVLRRPANGLATLAGAALIVLLHDPNALFSASFQMSYGVVLAILCFGIPLSEWFERRWAPFQSEPKVLWKRWQRVSVGALRWLWPMLGIGISATLVSTVTGPEFFNVLAPIGFISNLVLVPMAMLVIIAGFASIVAGTLGLLPIVVLFNHAALLTLVCINALIRFSIGLPVAWCTAKWRVDWGAPTALALLLGTILFGYACQWRLNRGSWWPPIAVAALALTFGVAYG